MFIVLNVMCKHVQKKYKAHNPGFLFDNFCFARYNLIFFFITLIYLTVSLLWLT